MLRLTTLPLATLAAAGLFAIAPYAAAQDETPTFDPARLILTTEAGEEFEYTVGDASFYVSKVTGYDGQPDTVDFSLSLSTISPIDNNLLEWSAQTVGKSKGASDTRSVTVIGTTGAENGNEEVRYEVTDASVTSVSISQSTYSAPSISLSLMAGTLAINGVEMN